MYKKLIIPLMAGALALTPWFAAEASHWFQARRLARLQDNAAALASLWINYALGDPSFDPTSEDGAVDCALNQPRPGQVTVLTGSFGGVANRSCDVPARTPLFFPVLNNSFINTVIDEVCTDDADCAFVNGSCNADSLCVTGFTVEDKVFITERFSAVDDHCNMQVVLDGQAIYPAASSVPLLRTSSDPTPAINPATGFLDPEAIANGHWALVPGLSRGPHTLQFSGSTRGSDGVCGSAGAFSLDVTYNLNVVRRGH